MPETTKQRPKFLSLADIRMPMPAVASIMHRISGGAMFLMLPALIYMLELSLGSVADFARLKEFAGCTPVKLALLALLWGFIHHFCMGIRILLIDVHRCVDLENARASTVAVFCFSIPLALILGVKLW